MAPAARDAAWSTATTGLDLTRARVSGRTPRLTNVSTRARAGSGADTLIAGAIVQGSGTLPLLVRAIGPGLARFGVTNPLRDPQLEIFGGNARAAQTTSLPPGAEDAARYVGAFPATAATASLAAGDAGLLGQVSAGMLTAHCSPAGAGAGVALLEFYDASAAPTETSARFVNLSARARVEPGDGVIVIGFVVTGDRPLTLLLRGIGPTLAQFGVTGTLPDPRLELYAGRVLIAANDSWQVPNRGETVQLADAELAAGAFALTHANDAAMVVTVFPGSYTLQVHGAAGQSGIALAEIHEVVLGNTDTAQGINAVGLNLYRELSRAASPANLIISPYSISSALALAYAGADGATREEMASVLRFPADDATLQSEFAGLRRALDRTAADSVALAASTAALGGRLDPIEWSAANRLFGQFNYPFRPAFLALMRDGFEAPLQPADFVGDAERERLAINAWVEEQTRQKIRNLIPFRELDETTRLVLVNALYLKAPWDVPFPATATAPRAFRPTPGTSHEVPTMQRVGTMGHAVEDGMTIVTLDYVGRGLQFIIALPDEGITAEAAAARLTPAHFARWAQLGDANRAHVSLSLPKFRVEAPTIPLGKHLEALGLRQAFDVPVGTANFDRMAPRRPDEYLYISKVFHQTFVALDELGTEAAAATAVVISVAVSSISFPPPPIEVKVDRPFLFAIQHRASGACLFLGRIGDPR